MADNNIFKETVGDINILYELSLSIGQSLDLISNCDGFIKALMARKNLSFASVWIKNKYLPEKESERGATLVYAHPNSRARETELDLDHPIFRLLRENNFVSLSSPESGYKDIVTEKGMHQGTFTLFSLNDIGVIKLFSSTRKKRWGKKELRQFFPVTSKFAVSLEGCLAYRKSRREIVERKHTEETLRRERDFNKNLLQASPAFFVAISSEGRTLMMNKMMLTTLGYTRDQVVGTKYLETFVPEYDREQMAEIFDNLTELHRPTLNRNHVLTKDGRELLVEWHGIPMFKDDGEFDFFFGVGIDITKHKQSEETLRQERDFSKRLLQALPTFFVALSAEGRTLMMNKIMLKTLGYTEDEAIGTNYLETFVPEEDRERTGALFEEQINIIEPTRGQNQVLTKDGQALLVEWHNIPVFKKNGEFDFFFSLGIDITERKQMEEELLKASKLESLGIMAGGIAHDFNNILTGILGNISLARLEIKSDEKVINRLKEAEKASLRAKNLTQQLLTFSRGGTPIKRIALLSDFLQEVIDFALSGSNVTCDLSLPDNLWPVVADVGQISQVIDNLVINAVQAMPEGGTIIIRAINTDIDDPGHIPLEKGKYVKITLRDQGIGIKNEHLARIFDPFFTTKQKGSGLGLTSAYSILKNHGGLITVDSRLHQGTIFSIYLPASSQPVIKTETKGEREYIPGTGRILIVDDEDVVREVAARIVRLIGYRSDMASSGKEGIDLYKRAEKEGLPYDAVLLDLTMPGGMGGKEVAKRIRAIDRQAKIIASSGYSTDPIMSNFKKFGFEGALAKPYKIEELSRILDKVIR